MTDVMKVKMLLDTKMNCRYSIAADEIVRACKQNKWYTCGTMTDYAKMLAEYDVRELTAEEFKELAIDICIHSENEDGDDIQMLGHVMDVLEQYTMKLWYQEKETTR